MNPLEYIRSLAPVYERREVTGVLFSLQEELGEHTLPTAQEVQSAFADSKYTSKYHQAIAKELTRFTRYNGNAFDVLVGSLELMQGNFNYLEKEIKRQFSFTFSPHKMTYSRVTLLRYVEHMGFYLQYFRRMMIRLVAEETMAHGRATPLGWAKAETKWLDDNLRDFCAIFPTVALDERQLKALLDKASPAEVDEETFEVASKSIGAVGMDPTRSENLVSPAANPFFWLGKALAEVQVLRYQGAKEEHKSLQLRLQEYREMADGGNASPKLQKLISYTEERIDQLAYKVSKIEDANRLD